jgi:hypothetical protein
MSSGYHIQIPPTTELHRKEIELRIGQLKEVFGQYERWFHTEQEVVDYLNACGVRQEFDRVITKNILRRFRNKMNFPYGQFHMGKMKLNTSNLMIMAWIWSIRVYKVTKLYKPAKKGLADATAHLL